MDSTDALYQLTPALLLTAAGAPVAAMFIFQVVQFLKGTFPFLITKSLTRPIVNGLSLGLAGYGYIATIHTPNAVGVIAALAAAFTISRLSASFYDNGVDNGTVASNETTLAVHAANAAAKETGASQPVSQPAIVLPTVQVPVEAASDIVDPVALGLFEKEADSTPSP